VTGRGSDVKSPFLIGTINGFNAETVKHMQTRISGQLSQPANHKQQKTFSTNTESKKHLRTNK